MKWELTQDWIQKFFRFGDPDPDLEEGKCIPEGRITSSGVRVRLRFLLCCVCTLGVINCPQNHPQNNTGYTDMLRHMQKNRTCFNFLEYDITHTSVNHQVCTVHNGSMDSLLRTGLRWTQAARCVSASTPSAFVSAIIARNRRLCCTRTFQ